MGTLLKSLGRGGEGRGGGSFAAWFEEGGKELSLSFSAYLAALKGVMEAARGGYIIIIIITGSDKHGFPLQRTDNSQKAKSILPLQTFSTDSRRDSQVESVK